MSAINTIIFPNINVVIKVQKILKCKLYMSRAVMQILTVVHVMMKAIKRSKCEKKI